MLRHITFRYFKHDSGIWCCKNFQFSIQCMILYEMIWFKVVWQDMRWHDAKTDEKCIKKLREHACFILSLLIITRCIIIYRRLLQHHDRCDYSGTRQWGNFSIDNSNNKICSGKTALCSRRWYNCDLQLCICNVRWALKHQFLWQQGDNTFVHEWIV